jgi:hypothetical protein
MSESTYQAILAKLAKPFPFSAIQFRPGATNRAKTQALGLAYVDPREYIKRLNDVAGNWEDGYDVTTAGSRLIVVCRLTIAGVTRTGDGECDLSDKNAMTSASAQAFKRACVKHGLGAGLYEIEKTWAELNAKKTAFTDAGLAKLQASLSRGGSRPAPKRAASKPAAPAKAAGGNGNGDDPASVVVPFGKHKGHTLGQVAADEPGYLKWLAENAKSDKLRQATAQIIERATATPAAKATSAGAAPFA